MTDRKKIRNVFAFLIFLIIILFFISLSVGYANSSFQDIIDVFIGTASPKTILIISKIRLPRILVAMIGGASLALAGLLLQTLTRNPLADSGILGINAGTGLIVSIMVGLSATIHPIMLSLMPVFAILGGILTISLVYLIAKRKDGSIQPIRLIITGVGISSLLSGIMVSVISRLDDFKMEYIVQWLSGKINGGDWQTLTLYAPLLLLTWLVTYRQSHPLNILTLNDQTAISLGLDLQKERAKILALATILAALSVVFVGNITFVGLVSGHIARKWLGNNHRILIPASMGIGMSLLLVSDTVGRVLLVGTGIPTGIILAVIGAPYFLFIMYKRN